MLLVFPRKPPAHLWAQILPGVNSQLTLHSETPVDSAPAEPVNGEMVVDQAEVAPTNEVVDAPLVRAFNLLRKYEQQSPEVFRAHEHVKRLCP